jgi:hypothetical protein
MTATRSPARGCTLRSVAVYSSIKLTWKSPSRPYSDRIPFGKNRSAGKKRITFGELGIGAQYLGYGRNALDTKIHSFLFFFSWACSYRECDGIRKI